MASILMHGLAFSIAVLAVMDAPRVDDSPVKRRYTTRIVKLQATDPQLRWSPGTSAAQPTSHAEMRAASSGERHVAAVAPQSLAYRVSAPITLVQPDIAQNILLPLKAPIPLIVMWTPPNLPVEKIVPPPPKIRAAANVRPSLSMPNHEAHVANIQLASASFVSQTIPIPASTTSPIILPGQSLSQVPQTASNPSTEPTPATVLSVSDVLLSKGTVALPPANETAAASISDSFAPGRPKSTSQTGDGAAVGQQNGNALGATSGNHGDQKETAVGPPGEKQAGSNSGSDSGLPSGNGASIDRITRPKDGHFGVVVVGDSVADQYPEAAGIWADRLAYTVYLHVGAAKSWILQYCVPRVVQAAGNSTRPDAPWPYLIVTPHLPPGDADSDALLVHGFIDAAGRFEKLAIVFPAQFAQSKFVLAALQQWQFRPAAQNGQSTAVEVLLIIPEETE